MAADRFELALGYAVRCETEADVESLIAQFRALIADFGFEACAGGAWIRSGALNLHRFYFNNWPPAWAQTYEVLAEIEGDPVVAEAGRRMRPFLVSEIRQDPEISKSSQRMLAAFDDFGWRDVFAIPIHGPFNYGGLVALATTQEVALDASTRFALELTATALHRRCRETPEFGLFQPPIAALTARQLECLRWASAGKSDAEIGRIVGISADTAHFHIEQAKQRLKAKSRAAAIGLALLSGQI